MALTSKQRRHLRGLAHHLEPVVMTGQNGLTANVLKEVEQTLNSRELIKVKLACEDQAEFEELSQALLKNCKAELVQVIGHIVVLFRQSKDNPKVALPS